MTNQTTARQVPTYAECLQAIIASSRETESSKALARYALKCHQDYEKRPTAQLASIASHSR